MSIFSKAIQIVRKITGEEVKPAKGKDFDYWRLQDIANEEGIELTVKLQSGAEVKVRPNDSNEDDEFDTNGKYAW